MSVAIVVLIVLLTVMAVMILGVVIFIRRRGYSKRRVTQHPVSNEQVERQQNNIICHTSTDGNNRLSLDQ